MSKIGSRLTALTVGIVALAGALTGALAGCSDDASVLGARGGPGGSSGSSGAAGGDGGSSANPGGPRQEQVLFQALAKDLDQKCGKACHALATYKPTPPAFLAPPDAYKSIKGYPGIVTADYYQSSLLQKGAHAGPAVGDDPTFEAKVIEWLKMESAVIQGVAKATTHPVAVKNGANDIDMTKAAATGLTGVHLLFDASLVGGILSLNNIKLRAGAGTDVHILKPRFIKVLKAPDASKRTEIPDGAETFSNTDQTVPGGADTVLTPGSAFLTADGWTPFNFADDKIRVEVEKLEPGKVAVIEKPKVCKNVAGFTTNVLPSMRGAGGFNLNCSACHGNGLAGMSLNAADQTVVCNQVMQKLSEADITKSLLVTKVTAGNAHNGGSITDIAGWTAVFVNNKAVFF